MDPKMEDLWIVIPAYNEVAMIKGVLSELEPFRHHTVVVDDGSQDNTCEVAQLSGVTILRHAINLGQGAALQTGISYCLRKNARFICTFDADGQHCAEAIHDMFHKLVESGSAVALGSRTLGMANRMPASRRLLLRAAVWFTWMHSGIRVSDTHNGLRLFTADAARAIRLTQPRMAHASEILRQISLLKLKFVEVPVSIRYTPYSLGKGQTLGGALRILLDLFYTIWTR